MNADCTHNHLRYGATLTRLSLGVILLSHGLLKVFVFTIPEPLAF